ncbi:uncharacterized protein LOC129728949 [Wyeomyia smithii]|uniref:uncharacterized protein LOC129728949 n=1 Tax=Wyeomyia smithii TaxID=174621 RepID=UPI0024681BA6|nr:uncharacterized protein LOC129728949 [Wyeomyia smithii]
MKKWLEEQEMRKMELQWEAEMRELELKEKARELEHQLKVKQDHLRSIQELESNFKERMSVIDYQLGKIKTGSTAKTNSVASPFEAPSGQIMSKSTPLRNPDVTNPVKDRPRQQSDIVETDSDSATDYEDEKSVIETDSEIDKISDDEQMTNTSGSHKEHSQLAKPPPRSGPTKAQLAARHGISKQLPAFSGKPEDWPLFYAAYTSSTEACGFSDIDNLSRLQQCLKGNALDLVRGQLLLPKSVPRVIQQLRQHFGRPEQLLQSHLDRIHKLDSLKPNNLCAFIPFSNAVEQLCEHLQAAEMKQHLVNPLLIKDIVKKLPDTEKRQWVEFKRGRRKVTLRTLTNFLSRIAEDACEADVDVEFAPSAQATGGPSNKRGKEKGLLYNHYEDDSSSVYSPYQRKLKPCKMCKRTDHRLRYCQDFKALSYEDRVAVVNRNNLCKLCLGEHGGQCRFKFHCTVGEYNEAHNALMHPVNGPSNRIVGMSAHIRTNSPVMFRIIPVDLHCGVHKLTVLAFLDEGASVTLVESSLADRLGVVGVEEKLTIRWTTDVSRVEEKSRKVNVWASAVGSKEKIFLRTVRTVGRLMLPRQKLNVKDLAEHYSHMRGLPIASYDGHPEILIVMNNVHSFAPLEVKIGSTIEPIAVRCKLGWTAYDPNQADPAGGYVCFHQEISNEDIHDLLKKHYALEESVVAKPAESTDDARAREIMERTTKRIGERFETGLLWKSDNVQFPDSRPMALRRLLQLERKLAKNPELYQNVRTQIVDYQQKGYAHVATKEELTETENNKAWYLPINVVINPKKTGKVRLVWDAAATVQGVSLNSQLLKGPDLLVPLVNVIIGFREKRIAIEGDLEEMFHQLKIIRNDRQAQRFLF